MAGGVRRRRVRHRHAAAVDLAARRAAPVPEAVSYDAALAQPWRPVPAPSAKPRRLGPVRRFWKRADIVERTRIYVAVRRRGERGALVTPLVDVVVVAYRSADTLRGCVEPLAECRGCTRPSWTTRRRTESADVIADLDVDSSGRPVTAASPTAATLAPPAEPRRT